MYQISVEISFSGAHSLRGYDGPCAKLHGHNFRVRAQVSGDKLDDVGMLVDFKQVKSILKQITDRFDHEITNDVEPFDQLNPTAENMARHICDELSARLPSGVRVDSVGVWETDKYGAVYTPDL